MQNQNLADTLLKRLGTLKGDRQQHVTTWEDCFRFTYPMRGTGFYGYDANASQGQNERARLLDSTGTDSTRNLASNVMAGMTPANARWFELEVDHQSDDEKLWLDESADLLWRNIHASNFDSQAFEGVLDCVISGWFALFIDEDRENGGLKFEYWNISELFIAASKKGGIIDIVYRPFKMTAEQAINELGEENVSQKVRDAAVKDPDCKIEFVHCIYPRTMSVPNAVRARNLPIASVIIECDSKKVVRESGFHEMPVIVPRWMVMPGSNYAVGPVFEALPDMKQLNLLCGFELAAAELAVAGMWIAEDDGVLNPRTVRVGPRKVIIASSVDSMKELKSGADFNVSFTMKQQLQQQIRRTMMADQLQPQDGPAMTATEVHVRVELIRQLLGPIYGRLQAEYLQPMINRCFGLAYRAGIFSPPPQSLAGRSFNVKYVSPLARAQQLEDVTAVERLYADLGAIAQAKQDPSVFDVVDDDEAARVVQEGLGAPARIMRKSEDVRMIRDARAKAQQQAQQQAVQTELGVEAGKAAINTMAQQAQAA